MVCLGNICRSPLAEGVLRQKIEEYNIKNIEVDSCGTSNYHIGQAPDQRTQDNALQNGTNLSQLRARQFEVSDFDRFDKIYVMDSSNKSNVLELARNEADKNKVDLFLNIRYPNQNLQVPDPYFGGEQGFQNVYKLVDETCEALIS